MKLRDACLVFLCGCGFVNCSEGLYGAASSSDAPLGKAYFNDGPRRLSCDACERLDNLTQRLSPIKEETPLGRLLTLRNILRAKEGEPLSFEEVNLVKAFDRYTEHPYAQYAQFLKTLYCLTALLETPRPSYDEWWPSEVESSDKDHPLNILKHLAMKDALPEAAHFLNRLYASIDSRYWDTWITENRGALDLLLGVPTDWSADIIAAWESELVYFDRLIMEYQEMRVNFDSAKRARVGRAAESGE